MGCLGDDFRDLLSRVSWECEGTAVGSQPGDVGACSQLPLVHQGTALCPLTYLSVRALLWVSLAAWRSSSRRLLSVSSLSTSPRVHFLGLINRISFKSSSFSLISIRRSRSESSTPGQASLSSLASWIFRFAILQGKKKQLFPEECLICSRHSKVHHHQPHLPRPWGRLSAQGQPPSCAPYQNGVKWQHPWDADMQNGILIQVCSQRKMKFLANMQCPPVRE